MHKPLNSASAFDEPDRPDRPAKMTILGILGGIASGKSHVSKLLAGPDGLILSADEAAHDALRSPAIVQKLVAAFGSNVVDQEGVPDRAALARTVFDDPGARKQLEEWIHPKVRAALHAALEGAAARGVSRVVLDVPLLLENAAEHGLLARCDHLVFIDTKEADRDARAVATRGWASGEVSRREAAQMPLAQKRARADIVIDNRGDLESLTEHVRAELRRLNLS